MSLNAKSGRRGHKQKAVMTDKNGFRWKLAVFDCDGTLVDSQHFIVETMTAAFRETGRRPPPAAAIRRIVGLSLEAAIARLLADRQATPAQEPADAAVEELAALYRRHFFALRTRPDHHEPLFPGVREALKALEARDVFLGIATGKARRGLLATLERHGLAQRFVTLQTADLAPGKPHPGMLQQAMAEAGVEAGETVLIGDTSFDMEMARNAGVLGLGVSWGYHEVEELTAAGAARVIDSFAELLPALSEIGKEEA